MDVWPNLWMGTGAMLLGELAGIASAALWALTSTILGGLSRSGFIRHIFAQQIETSQLHRAVYLASDFDSVVQALASNESPRDSAAQCVVHDQRREPLIL